MTTWKRMFAVAAPIVVLGVLYLGLAPQVAANPPGIPQGAKLEYKFNLIGYPEGQDYQGGCGQGRRIFVNRDAHHAHMLITAGDSWDIIDCNATGNNRAELQTDARDTYLLFVRILGQPGGHLNICADTYEDHELGEELCLLGEIDLTRGSGRSNFGLVPSDMYDASLEDIIWSMDTNGQFKIAQFRLYSIGE